MIRSIIFGLMVLLLCLPFQLFSESLEGPDISIPEMLDGPYVEGELFIRYVSSAQGIDREEIHLMTGVMTVETDFSDPHLELVRLPDGVDMAEAIDYFQKLPAILYVSPNYILSADAGIFWPKKPSQPVPNPGGEFNDPFFHFSYGVKKVEAPKVWKNFTIGSREVIVAVIDSGIDYRHEDLAENMWKNTREIPGNGLDDDNNGYVDDIYGWNFYNNTSDPFDDNKHGTHVSGIIGAVAGNSKWTIGVSPKVAMMACKFLGSDGRGSTSAAIRAIEYAVNNGAKVLNNSWGGKRFSLPLLNTITWAKRMGVLFVAAAGNGNENIDENPLYPASYGASNIVTVGSTDTNDVKSNFSNYGKVSVDLAAPGTAIYSTLPNGWYGTLSGTSMSTPHVSGAAALMWAYRPDLNFDNLQEMILKSVDPIASMRGITVTGGRLNVYNALALALLML